MSKPQLCPLLSHQQCCWCHWSLSSSLHWECIDVSWDTYFWFCVKILFVSSPLKEPLSLLQVTCKPEQTPLEHSFRRNQIRPAWSQGKQATDPFGTSHLSVAKTQNKCIDRDQLLWFKELLTSDLLSRERLSTPVASSLPNGGGPVGPYQVQRELRSLPRQLNWWKHNGRIATKAGRRTGCTGRTFPSNEMFQFLSGKQIRQSADPKPSHSWFANWNAFSFVSSF